MPGRFLTDAERERFTGFPKTIPLEECVTSFTLSPADLALVRLLRGGKNRLGFALQLGSIRYLGFAPDEPLDCSGDRRRLCCKPTGR